MVASAVAGTWPTSCRATGHCWSCGATRWQELSAHIRANGRRRAGLGRCSVDPRRQPRRRGTHQARLNDYTLRVHGSRPVTNREVYEVIGRNRWTGALTVRDRDRILAHLPAAYVKQHTTLACGRHHGQGQTVYSSHSLVDQGATRAGVYVPGPRHRHNTFYVICQHAPDHHDPERIDRTPVAVLTDILIRPSTAPQPPRSPAARRTNPRWLVGPVGPPPAEYSRHRATDTLTRLLP
jgi:hypothetical protein